MKIKIVKGQDLPDDLKSKVKLGVTIAVFRICPQFKPKQPFVNDIFITDLQEQLDYAVSKEEYEIAGFLKRLIDLKNEKAS